MCYFSDEPFFRYAKKQTNKKNQKGKETPKKPFNSNVLFEINIKYKHTYWCVYISHSLYILKCVLNKAKVVAMVRCNVKMNYLEMISHLVIN